jgi:3-methyl-2-oxobutanoate hydroxymethyltransferase
MADKKETTGYLAPTRQVRIGDLRKRKGSGDKWAMLTAYDYSTARAFSDAGVECLLVGDSAANVVFGYPQTQQISLDEMIYIAAAVVRGAQAMHWLSPTSRSARTKRPTSRRSGPLRR